MLLLFNQFLFHHQHAMIHVKLTVLARDPKDVLNVPVVIPRLMRKVVKVGL